MKPFSIGEKLVERSVKLLNGYMRYLQESSRASSTVRESPPVWEEKREDEAALGIGCIGEEKSGEEVSLGIGCIGENKFEVPPQAFSPNEPNETNPQSSVLISPNEPNETNPQSLM